MHRCGVIGNPISHSLSPLVHRTAYAQLGIADRFTYDAFDVTPDYLDQFITGLGPEWVGLSVTAPHKQALLRYGSADPIAQALRSANTIIFGSAATNTQRMQTCDGLTRADPLPVTDSFLCNRVYNTDVTGMLSALATIEVDRASTALVTGNGATARSSLWALGRLGVRRVIVLARSEQRARASLEEVAHMAGIDMQIQPYGRTAHLPKDWGPRADLLISTAPVDPTEDLADALVKQADAVFEVVYTNYPSGFDLAAAKLGVPALDGCDLLVGQAIDQIKMMTGLQPDPAPLLTVCRAELANRAGADQHRPGLLLLRNES